MTPPDADIQRFGERGWIATWRGVDDPVAAGLAANAVADALRGRDGIVDAVAGIGSVAVRGDWRVSPEAVRAALHEALRAADIAAAPVTTNAPPLVLPVRYGGADGPDLPALAAATGLSPAQIIERHAARIYTVASLGFAPGFAYLGPLDPSLAAPRLDAPRQAAPAGAVGVAGEMTCVYPLASPGGWNLIGRTTTRLFDPHSDTHFILKPGDRVRFDPVDGDGP